MPSLAETQTRLRAAIVAGDTTAALPLLAGSRDSRMRLAIHQRHYEASLTEALLTKFPATIWLTGSSFVTEAARAFVRAHPPSAPCIAEYGADFPEFLAGCAHAEGVPYLRSFAELEWHIGHVSIAIDDPTVTLDAFRDMAADALPDAVLALQPSIRWLAAPWPIDDLIKLYLTGAAPDRYAFAPADVWLQIRGARGEFRIERLDAPAFAFRQAIAGGRSIGAAAEGALDLDPRFDCGRALGALVAENLVIAVKPSAGART